MAAGAAGAVLVAAWAPAPWLLSAALAVILAAVWLFGAIRRTAALAGLEAGTAPS
jgi:hypothetical protein